MSIPSFEERFGLPKKGLQVNEIDFKTRIRLWNELNISLWPELIPGDDYDSVPEEGTAYHYIFSLWSDVMGWDYGLIPERRHELINYFRSYVLEQKLGWKYFLKFIEKASTNYLDLLEKDFGNVQTEGMVFELYTNRVNRIFIEESCGYRFVGRYLTPIIDEVEIQEVSDALVNTQSLITVKNHLINALIHLSDREHPNFNNSIKESISALEALCKLITNDPNITLSKALSRVEQQVKIHTALKEAIAKLYAWAGDAPGIRHAEKGGPTENFDRAKLTLVICSGIVNYLISKCEEENINLY